MLTFSEAVTALRAGRAVRRRSWPDGVPVSVIFTSSSLGLADGSIAELHFRPGDYVMHPAQFWWKQPVNAAGVADPIYAAAPWTASAEDVIATDWIIVPRPGDTDDAAQVRALDAA